MMNGDKTTGWLGADYNKLTNVWCYIWRNFDSHIKNKFENPSLNTMKHTSKMCTTYLKLHNHPIPAKLDEKSSTRIV